MLKIQIYNFESGEKKGEKKVSAAVFGETFKASLVHQAYVTISANQRQTIAHTKDRSERSGSGKKPWKQKGTGNARVGSVRSPLWRKGGIVFGPKKERNFSKDINNKMKKKATLMALGEKIKKEKIRLVDEIKLEKNKTKNFFAAMKKLALDKSTLIALAPDEKEMIRYCRNIRNASVRETKDLNVFDLMNNDYLLMSERSFDLIEEKAGKKIEPAKK